jgi:DNA-binding transcriptional LysR family regulator
MVETSHLQTLLAISQTGSFSKAAEEMGVTQSAISQSVKNLEKRVGVTVITRKGKTISLTPEGQRLCKLAQEFLFKLSNVVTQIQEEQNKMVGRLRVGTLIGIGKSWVASRVIEFAKEFPDIDVTVTLDFPDNLIKAFDRNELDYIIVPEYHVPSSSDRWELNDEYTTLVFPDSPDYPIDDKIDSKTLSSYPLIHFQDRDQLFFRWCREKFGSAPRNMHKRFVVNSFGHMLQAVHDGLGIAVIPKHVLKRSYFKDKISTLGKQFEVLNDRFYFAFHPDDGELMKTKALYDFLRREKDVKN